MGVYIYLLIPAMFSQAVGNSEMPLNVGSVLFSINDSARTKWSQDELTLLHARRFSQKLLPPINPGAIVNEAYVTSLLSYFKEIYKTVKLESTDARTCNVMTTAVSDVLGGFFKSWLLPVTKFAFYGGTISSESAQKFENFYTDVKKFLRTDGSGWRTPNVEQLNHIAVYITSSTILLNVDSLKKTKDPCDKLGFFEKTSKGLRIPMPTVTWERDNAMMFLPLKDRSLISLNSPASGNSLFKYYDSAVRCARTTGPADESDFDRRFETWVIHNVVPHLNDEQLYYGLDSVLSLIKNTEEVSKRIVNFYLMNSVEDKFTSEVSEVFASKKVIIITLILFLEICWCIPAIFYVKCSKDKKKCQTKDNIFNVCVSYGEKRDKEAKPKQVNGNEDHTVKFQKLHNFNLSHCKEYAAANSTSLSKSACPTLVCNSILKTSTNQMQSKSVPKASSLKQDPCSHATIDSSSGGVYQKLVSKKIEPFFTKNVTKNNIQRNVSIQDVPKVLLKQSEIQHSKEAVSNKASIPFKTLERSSSLMQSKTTRVRITEENEQTEKKKNTKLHKLIKIKNTEKGQNKSKISLTCKVQRPEFVKGIKITPEKTEKCSLDNKHNPLRQKTSDAKEPEDLSKNSTEPKSVLNNFDNKNLMTTGNDCNDNTIKTDDNTIKHGSELSEIDCV